MKEYNRDEFWKIDKLVPKKQTTMKPFSTKAKTVEYTIPSDTPNSDGQFKLTVEGGIPEARADVCYTPSRGLIKSVIVRHTPDKFDFHGGFLRAAHLYFNFRGSECDFAPYYSYMPQYAQLTEAQKNYYFYFRSAVREGNYIKTDYSYLYLYAYEIINLPDLIPPSEGVAMLSALWRAYRKALPNIDANFSLWIQDYCLVYQVECPMDELREFLFSASSIPFKEFYLSDAESLGIGGVGAVVSYLSDYDWRAGKYAGGDNKEVYKKHLLGAMGLFISEMLRDGKIISTEDDAVMERQAFRGALLTSGAKYRVICKYRPISEDSALRKTVTSLVKYTENKLRALLSVKSRLSVGDIPKEYSMLIVGYFAELFERVNRERIMACRPEYEKLYESESRGISTKDADEIERLSWSTTARLVENTEDYSEEDSPSDSAEQSAHFSESVTEQPQNDVDTYGLTEDMIEFVRAALSSDFAAEEKIASQIGELTDSLADAVNEAFADGFGDVVLENSCDGYVIIEDYKEEISAWLLKIQG